MSRRNHNKAVAVNNAVEPGQTVVSANTEAKPAGVPAAPVPPAAVALAGINARLDAILSLPSAEAAIVGHKQTAVAIEIMVAISAMELTAADFANITDSGITALRARKKVVNLQRAQAINAAFQDPAHRKAWDGAEFVDLKSSDGKVIGQYAQSGPITYRRYTDGRTEVVYNLYYNKFWACWFGLACETPAEAFDLLKLEPRAMAQALTKIINAKAAASARTKANAEKIAESGKIGLRDSEQDGEAEDGSTADLPANIHKVANTVLSVRNHLIEYAKELESEAAMLEAITATMQDWCHKIAELREAK